MAVLALVFVFYRLVVAPRALHDAAHAAPRVTYATLDGREFVLAHHRGRVVFLDFWATWCYPCKAEMPFVEAFARAHPDSDVELIDVAEPKALVEMFARTHGLQNVALDPQALSRGFFQIGGFPTIVVIDPRGRIRATWAGFNPAVGLNMAHAASTLEASS